MAHEETALIPQRERTVDFYEDAIPVAQVADGTLYVALRPITDFLGLQFSAQRRRILRDEILAERMRSVLMTAADGRQREQLCLPLDLLPGWLFGVTPSQARPEIMDKLKRYRADCFRVLWEAFAGEARALASATTLVPAPANPDITALEHIEQMGLAIATMARQQIAFEQQVDMRLATIDSHVVALTEGQEAISGRLDQAAAVVGSLLRRVNTVEGLVTSGQTISDIQAAEISALVKAIAGELTERDKSSVRRVATTTKRSSPSCTAASACRATITYPSSVSTRSSSGCATIKTRWMPTATAAPPKRG